MSKKLLKEIISNLDDNKAKDITSIPLEGKSDIADHLVIATGTSSRHVSSLAQRIVNNLKEYGLKSINEHLSDNNYPRLRFGIGDSFSQGQQSNYVLGKFNNEEKKDLDLHIEECCDAIESFILQGLEKTMNTYN